MGREHKCPRLMMRIHQYEKRFVLDLVSITVYFRNGVAGQSDAQASGIALIPIVLRHLLAVGSKPGQILDLRPVNAATLEELPSMKDRVFLAKLDEEPCEIEQLLIQLGPVPIEPADLIVLTVAVVVALLGPPDLITHAMHRHALRKKERGQHVALLPLAQRIDREVIGRPFSPAIPALVVVGAVTVVFAVGFVVFVIVRLRGHAA